MTQDNHEESLDNVFESEDSVVLKKADFVISGGVEYKSPIMAEHRRQYIGKSLVYVSGTWIIKNEKFVDLIEELTALLGDGAYYNFDSNSRAFVYQDTTLLVLEGGLGGTRSVKISQQFICDFSMQGARANIEKVIGYLDKNYSTDIKRATAKWWYMTAQGPSYAAVLVEPPNDIHQEFYPWLPNMRQFFKDYLKSSAPLLFLSGPPGTGKTTLLRSMIYENDLPAAVAYDEDLFEQDSMFINFLTSDDTNVLIIEDADLILTSREHNGNKLVARFLNISDGIIRFPNKKIIFTTNLRDFRDVDEALLRPGRCFALAQARDLTPEEAQEAATKIGTPLIDGSAYTKNYSLAEIFCGKKAPRPKSIGFAA